MAVSVDGFASIVPFNLPGSEPASEAGQPEDFAYLYQLAAHADLGEQPLTAADTAVDEDEASAKKLADEQSAVALLLFLFSQTMPSTPPPADIRADEGEDAAAIDVIPSEKTRRADSALPLDAAVVTDDLPEVDNRSETPIKPATAHPEKATGEISDKDLAAQPVKTLSAAPTAELPIRPTDKRRAVPLSENTAAPRALLQSSYGLPSAVASPEQAQALPLRSGQFSELLSQRVMWLSSQNLQAAQIELSPKELGMLELRVALADGQAEVRFVSNHAEVRTVLEGHLPRLQEMLENQGLPGARLGVFDSSSTQNQEQGQRQERPAVKPTHAAQVEEDAERHPLSSQTLIDYYA